MPELARQWCTVHGFTDSEEAAALGPGRASVFADGSMVVVVAWMAGWDVASPDGTGADGMWVDDDAMEEIDGWA